MQMTMVPDAAFVSGLIQLRASDLAFGRRVAAIPSSWQDEVYESFAPAPQSSTTSFDVWLAVYLNWIVFSHPEREKISLLIDRVYADFDYPALLEPLVSYMPAPAGIPPTEPIEERAARLAAHLLTKIRGQSAD
jgi:hypothetical protein